MMHSPPPYTKPEIERRWLLQPGDLWDVQATRERKIEDRYILETRLRLRKVIETGIPTIYKLGKKYEPVHLVLTTSFQPTSSKLNTSFSQAYQQGSLANLDSAFTEEHLTSMKRLIPG